mmetsp:Transcript_38046/g.80141  ORF Transcript_38046/g.80141 Transcript_38046/m.80141 type:complete len:93 (-) Transcript_38046:31-309(-)
MTRWYSVPSTREVVVRRWGGVSSSIHPAETVVTVMVVADANRRRCFFIMVCYLCLCCTPKLTGDCCIDSTVYSHSCTETIYFYHPKISVSSP